MLTRKPFIPNDQQQQQSPNKSAKNSNIFDIELKIVDFGIFGSASGNNPEKSNAGSLKYMAPEVLIGHTQSTAKLDVWSLGIILHGLLFGYLPFSSRDKDELKKLIIEKEINLKDHQVSEDSKDLIYKMLDKDPSKRIAVSEIFEHQWLSKYK